VDGLYRRTITHRLRRIDDFRGNGACEHVTIARVDHVLDVDGYS
jgi:hypothetical protein